MTKRWTHSSRVTGLLGLAVLGMVLISLPGMNKPYPEVSGQDKSNAIATIVSSASRLKSADPVQLEQPVQYEVNKPAPSVVRVYGVISDVQNSPLESAMVQVRGENTHVRSDARGGYRIDLPASRVDSMSLVFLRSGYMPQTIDLSEREIDPENPILLNMKLEYSANTITVDGWLSDTDGLAVAGQYVELGAENGDYTAISVTNKWGKFSFEAVTQGVDYALDIESSGEYKRYRQQFPRISTQLLPLNIQLESLNLRSIQGVVLDSYGLPVPGFVAIVRNMEIRDYTASLQTDEVGRFTLTDFPLGNITVTSDSDRLLNINRVQVTSLNHGDLVVPVDLGTHQVSGWVRDRHGKPVFHARVVMESEHTNYGIPTRSTRMEKTDKNGYYEFRGLSAAEYELTIYARGFINEGIHYHPGTGIDQLYFRLSRWSDSL